MLENVKEFHTNQASAMRHCFGMQKYVMLEKSIIKTKQINKFQVVTSVMKKTKPG